MRNPLYEWQEWWLATGADRLVLTPAELAAAGVSRSRARTLVRRGTWTAAGYGCVAAVDVRDPQPPVVARRRHALACVAACRRRPGSVVSGRSAAVLHGLPTYRLPPLPELTTPASTGLGRRGPAHVHGAGLVAGELSSWYGTPLTTPARTVVDLARHDRRDGIMAADAALAHDLVGGAQLDRALTLARGWPGVRQARAVLALADRRAESPLESITRLALHDDGFPAPEPQAAIPGTPFRVDLLWRAIRLILEVDGLAKYTDAELRYEKRRELRLRALGYRVERVGWDDVVLRWPQTRRWLRAAVRLPAEAG